MKPFETTALRFDGKCLLALDQRELPGREIWIDITHPHHAITAIQSLAVRGAPLIGVAAAVCLGRYWELTLGSATAAGAPGVVERPKLANTSGSVNFESVAHEVRCARPTAVNLSWAVDLILKTYFEKGDVGLAAERILENDRMTCERIAQNGSVLISDGDSVLTHCNAGALATAGVGTAIGIILKAHTQGKKIHVYVDETRPLLQGGRLTAWELKRARVPYTVICDNMSGFLMQQKKIQVALVGADRIARNGDFANKIGTYSVAVLCQYHRVPLVVAAPFSTVDLRCGAGSEIPIELRNSDEVQPGEPCWNPAFDITPSELVSKYVLESDVYLAQEFSRYLKSRI